MSGIAVGTAMAITAGVGAASSIGGAMIQSSAAGKAARAQQDSAKYAADLQKQAADESLAFQKEQYATNQKNLAPWLTAGTTAINNLSGKLQNGFYKPFDEQFKAPGVADMNNDPGFQTRLQAGQQILERGAAAKGRVLSGGSAKELTRYGQDYGSNEYDKIYQRSLNEYMNRFNIQTANNTNDFNREAAISGVGQQTGTTLGTLGNNTASTINNTLMSSAAQQGADYRAAGDARASGYINSANAWGSALNNTSNSITQALLLKLIMGGGGGRGPASPGIPISPGLDPISLDGGICWIAAELYDGWDDPRTKLIQKWLVDVYEKTTDGAPIVAAYRKYGERLASKLRSSERLRNFFVPLFDRALQLATESYGGRA